MNKGRFIVFEGGEGSGKTRHSKYAVEKLRKAGHDVLLTHEPGGTEIGKMIRQIILHENDVEVSARTELFLFLADRAQHIEEVIRPALEQGKLVVCDRFSGSTFAYQFGGRQLPDKDEIFAMDAYARAGIEPELVIYLDIDPKIGIQRKEENPKDLNRMDKQELAFHQRVHDYFQQLTQENEDWVGISTDCPKDESAEKVYKTIIERLSL
ncbi:dTMP kinase [Patescibacteria group bacterium]